MEMYDSVWVPCTKCNKLVEFQSKAGLCQLSNYNLSNAPADVLGDLAGDVGCCQKCGERFRIGVSISAWVESNTNPPDRGHRILGRHDDEEY